MWLETEFRMKTLMNLWNWKASYNSVTWIRWDTLYEIKIKIKKK